MPRRHDALEDLASAVREHVRSPSSLHGGSGSGGSFGLGLGLGLRDLSIEQAPNSRLCRRAKSMDLRPSYPIATDSDDAKESDEGAGRRRSGSGRRRSRAGSLVISDGQILPHLDFHGNFRDDDDANEGELGVESIVLPSDSAHRAVDAVQCLVSALFSLSDRCYPLDADSHSGSGGGSGGGEGGAGVPPSLMESVLEKSPDQINLAFGLIRGAISELEAESDVIPDLIDEGGESSGEGGSGEGSRIALLVDRLECVVEWIRAAAECVRMIADGLPGEVLWGIDLPSSLPSTSSANRYESFRSNIAATDGRSKLHVNTTEKEAPEALTTTRKWRLLECRYATIVELLSLTCWEVHRIDSGGAALNGASWRFDVSSECRRAWAKAGLKEELRAIRAASASASSLPTLTAANAGAGEGGRGKRSGGDNTGSNGSEGSRGGCNIDSGMFREVAALVLRRTSTKSANLSALSPGESSSFPHEDKKGAVLMEDGVPCLLDRVKEDGISSVVAVILGGGVGGDDLDLAEVLYRLGKVQTALGEHKVSLEHHKEVYRIRKSHLGDSHRDVVAALRAIGDSYRDMGQRTAADRCFAGAVEAVEKNWVAVAAGRDGEGSSSGLIVSGQIGSEADEATTEVTDLLTSLFMSWANLKVEMHDQDAAVEVLTRCAAAQRRTAAEATVERRDSGQEENGRRRSSLQSSPRDPLDSPALAATLYRRGSISMERGRDDAALSDFDEVLRIRICTLGVDHPSVGDIAHVIGVLQFKSGNHRVASVFLKDALRMRRMSDGPENKLKAADSMAVIGNVYMETGRSSEAVRLYREALALRTEVLGQEDERVADVHVTLGHAMGRTGRHEEAAGHYRAGLVIVQRARGSSDVRVPRFLQFLGTAQHRAGKLRMARSTFEELVRHLKREMDGERGGVSKGGGNDRARAMAVDHAHAVNMLEMVNQEIASQSKRASFLTPAGKAMVPSPNSPQRGGPQQKSGKWFSFFGRGGGSVSPKVEEDPVPSLDCQDIGHDSAKSEDSWLGNVGKIFGSFEGSKEPDPSSSLPGRGQDIDTVLPTARNRKGRAKLRSQASISAMKIADQRNSAPISPAEHLWASIDLTSPSSIPPNLNESSTTMDSAATR